jgi:hypothetical protein
LLKNDRLASTVVFVVVCIIITKEKKKTKKIQNEEEKEEERPLFRQRARVEVVSGLVLRVLLFIFVF